MADSSPGTLYLGYGGMCFTDWQSSSGLLLVSKQTIKQFTDENIVYDNSAQIFITGGNINLQYNRPTENTYFAPRDSTNVSQILLGPGTANITGSINFDMNHKNLSYYINDKRIARNQYFHLVMNDGNKGYYVTHNVWNSISFNASVGGLVTCSISYNSLNSFKDSIRSLSANTQSKASSIFDNTLVSYWEAGPDALIDSFAINFSQDVTPVYLNNDLFMPSYLRCGTFRLNANIETCIEWAGIEQVNNFSTSATTQNASTFSINIGSQKITIINPFIDVQQYSHGGGGDLGKYSYQLSAVSLSSPTASLFSISSVYQLN